MCCLFGLVDYGHRLTGRQKSKLLFTLSAACEARGTDATGYAYNAGDKLHIYKRPLPAHKLRPRIPGDAWVVMGHTRMTTQGSEKRNCNNHPFPGCTGHTRFALAHNGVLYNDRALRKLLSLPPTKIETDSYAAVQLLEREKAITADTLKSMAELVEGTFVFTVLDEGNNLWFVRGDNPLCLYHFPELGLYLYASTEQILRKGLARTWLSGRHRETVPVERGEIFRIDPEGRRQRSRFVLPEPALFQGGIPLFPTHRAGRHTHLEELKAMSYSFGYTPETVERLFREGLTTDEIEELFYSGEGMACWF